MAWYDEERYNAVARSRYHLEIIQTENVVRRATCQER
jgi:hypothetical protein